LVFHTFFVFVLRGQNHWKEVFQNFFLFLAKHIICNLFSPFLKPAFKPKRNLKEIFEAKKKFRHDYLIFGSKYIQGFEKYENSNKVKGPLLFFV